MTHFVLLGFQIELIVFLGCNLDGHALLDGEAEKAKQQLYCKPCMDQRNCPGQWPGQLYERVKVRRKKKRGDEFERTGAARWLLLFTPGVRLD